MNYLEIEHVYVCVYMCVLCTCYIYIEEVGANHNFL